MGLCSTASKAVREFITGTVRRLAGSGAERRECCERMKCQTNFVRYFTGEKRR
jgi:hypothetical protein